MLSFSPKNQFITFCVLELLFRVSGADNNGFGIDRL